MGESARQEGRREKGSKGGTLKTGRQGEGANGNQSHLLCCRWGEQVEGRVCVCVGGGGRERRGENVGLYWLVLLLLVVLN